MMNLKGIIPPITTPFDDEGEVSLDRLCENIRRWNQTQLAGYVVLGSTGEAAYLDEKEKIDIVRAARKVIPEAKTMIVGAGLESTKHTVAFIRRAADLGADGVIVGAPHYYKERMTEAVLYEHYMRVADGSPVPILLYNVPQFTGVALSPNLVARLAAHERIVGIKDSSGNIAGLSEMIRLTGRRFEALSGHPFTFFPALCVGATGGILAFACAAPRLCIELYESFVSGDYERARQLQFRLTQAATPINVNYGIPGLKAAMDLVGYYGGPPRAPLLPLRSEERQQIREAFEDARII